MMVLLKLLKKIQNFMGLYKENFKMINKNSKVGDKIDFFGFEYTVIELSETIDPYAEYSKHFVAMCYENGNQLSGGIPECKNPYFDVSGVLSGKKLSIYD